MEFEEFISHNPDLSGENTAAGYSETTDDFDEGDLNLAADTGEDYEVDDAPDEEPDYPPADNPVDRLEPVHAVELKPMTRAETDAAELRQKIMERAGHLHDPTGVDLERVDHFITALGMRAIPHRLLVRPDDVPELEAVLSDVLGSRYNAEIRGGSYFSQAGLYVVHPKEGSTERVREKITVHEATHADAVILPMPKYSLQNSRDLLDPSHLRPGFYNAHGSGVFFRETLAEWAAVNYDYVTNATPAPVTSDSSVWQPSKYVDLNIYTTGVEGLDVLFEHDPQLVEAMVRAQTETDGMEEFKERLHAIDRRLFRRLASIALPPTSSPEFTRYTEQQFGKAFESILSATGVDTTAVADISRGGAGMVWMRQKLLVHETQTGYRFTKPV